MQNLCTSLVTGRLINLTQVLYKVSRCLSFMCAQMYSYCPGTNTMKRSSFSEAERSSTSKIPLNRFNLHVHYHIRKCQPPVSILNQIRPVHVTPLNLLEIHFTIMLPSITRSSKWFYSPRSQTTRLYTYLLSPICATCTTSHLILDLIM